MTFPLRIVTERGASNPEHRVYIGMNEMKCDLCGVDDALADGLLCASCREAVARLVIIAERERIERTEAANAAMENENYPEATENTRNARP